MDSGCLGGCGTGVCRDGSISLSQFSLGSEALILKAITPLVLPDHVSQLLSILVSMIE